MTFECPRYSKTFLDRVDEKYDRLVFPKARPEKSIPYDGLQNYNHTSLFEDNDLKEYYTEMKDQFRFQKLPFDYNEGLRKCTLRKYYTKYLSNEAMHEIKFSHNENYMYNTEYKSNFSINLFRDQVLPKYPLNEREGNVVTFYTRNASCNKKNLLTPFNKRCYFSKPLSERMDYRF